MGRWEPHRRRVAVLLAAYSLLLAFVLLVPLVAVPSSGASWTGDLAARIGAPAWLVEPARWEFICNALILAPVSALGSVVWPRTTWRDWTAYGFAISMAVEIFQGLFLSERSASYVDVVANTLGAALGASVLACVRGWRRRSGT